ncbi:MAG: phosphatase PAP2 family protein [Candidatus Hydrothermia bacterium]
MTFLINIFLVFSIQVVDSVVLYRFRSATLSPFSDFTFKGLSYSANTEVILTGSLIYWSFSERRDLNLMKSYTAGLISSSIITQSLKFVVGRTRPDGENSRTNSSFPSGHSAVAFYVAGYFSGIYPKYRIPLYTWACGVALSRVYLKRHWPSDVIAGAIIGWGTAKFFYRHKDWFSKVSIF